MRKLIVFMLVMVVVLSMTLIPSSAEDDLVVDLGAIGGVENYGPHGYPDQKLLMFGYGAVVKLGNFDLSKYDAMEITYATDLAFQAMKEGMKHVAILGIKSAESPIFGYANLDFNEENSLGWAPLTDADPEANPDGVNWDKGERKCVIDLSEQNYSGDVYLMCYNSIGNETLVVGIKLIAKQENPATGDIGIVGMAIVSTFATTLAKKKRR
jgi:hypothetical protein